MNLLDDRWTALPVTGMLPTLREKLAGHEFDNLSQLAQKVSSLNSWIQSVRRQNRFQSSAKVVNLYESEEDTSDEEVAAAEWSWGKKTVLVPSPW